MWALFILGLCLGVCLDVARGATSGTWVTDGDGSWTDANNWVLTGVPDARGVAGFTNLNLTADRQITLAGATINISGMLFSNNSAFAYTFTTGAAGIFMFDRTATFEQQSSGAINFNMDVQLSSTAGRDTTMTGDGTGVVTINGVVSGANSLIKDGAFTLVLNGNNTFSVGMTNRAGVTEFGNDGAAGTGILYLDGGVIRAGGGARILANTTINNGDFAVAGVNALTLSGALTLMATNTFTITNTALTTFSGVIDGAGGIVKAGSQILVLSSGGDIYTGATVVSNGTLRLGASGSFSDSSAFTVVPAGTLDFNNFTDTIGSLAGSGIVTLGSGYFTAGGDNTSTLFGGVISGAGGFTKAGTGTMTLSSANTYTGTTTNSAGTLVVMVDNALGAAAGGTAVLSGATLGFTNNVNYAAAETLGIAGTGVGGLGAILNFSGANTFAGNITNTAAAMIGSGAGSLTLSGSITNSGFQLTVTNAAGSVVTLGGIVAGAGGLFHDGDGTTILAAANTYSGATTNRLGTLVVASDGALGTAAQGTRVLSGATLALSNNVNYATAEIVGIAGTGTGGAGAIENIQGDNVFAGVITNTAAAMIGSSAGSLTLSGSITNSDFQLIVTNAAGSVITLGGIVAGAGGLFHDGTGTTILAATNTYTGATTNRLGTLVVASDGALGGAAQGTRVLSGAMLAFSNNVNYTGAEIIGIAGTGTVGAGAIENIQGANAFAGVITNTAASTIGTSADSLTLSGNVTNSGYLLTLTNAPGTTLTISGQIQGAGGLNKDGTGVTVLSGVNQYWGATTLSGGTLQIGAGNAISNASAVTVAGGAILDLNGFSDRIGSLDGAGNVTLGAGRLYAGTNGTSTTSSGAISGAGGLTKEGTGTMVLAGVNTYDGVTTNLAGTLIVAANTALGSANAGAEVIAGATLGFSNNVTTTEQIMIAGAGVGGLGALNNLSGNNTVSGVITNTAAATIGASSGTLTLNGAIANEGFALTFTNAGGASIQVNAPISGAGALRNLGSGTTVLLANNGFTGNTVIDAGTLNLQADSALGSVTNVTVNPFGTLLFSGAAGATDRINDAATMTFLGGTLESPDYTETFGILSLGASSIFNLGPGGGQGDLTFSNAVWAAGTLTINNWLANNQYDPTQGGSDDRIFLTVNPGAGFLTNIFFAGFGQGATWVGGELTPSNGPAVWTGGGADSLWSTPANWDPSGNPAAGRALIFVGGSGRLTNNMDGAAAANYSAMNFATNAAGSFLIGGGAITNWAGGIANNSAYLQSFTNTVMVLTANQSWNAASNSLFISAGVTNSGNQLTLAGISNITVAGVINGAGGLYKSGAGAAILSGNNLYAGTTTNAAGTLIITANNALGTAAGGTVILTGGTLGISNSVNYSTAEALTLSGGGDGAQWGAFSSLGGSNTFAGAVTLAADSSIGASDGYLVLTSTIANGGFLLSVTNAAGATNVLSGVVSGTGGLAKFGGGILTLNAANTYSGATTISNGALRVGAAVNVLPNASAVTIGALGTLDLNNFTNNIGSLAGDGAVALGTGSLLAGGDNTSTTFSGAITGSGVFTKAGTGAMTLAGASAAYSGLITNSAGTLVVAADNALGTTAAITVVNSGATLGFSNDVNYATAEFVRIAGSGVNGQGAINNLGGVNTFAGGISNTAISTIASSAGTLTLSGFITNRFMMIYSNAANSEIILNGNLGGTRPLWHDGAGATVLAGNFTNFTGAITNNAGTLIVAADGGLGAVAGDTMVLSGGTLGFSNSVNYTTAERIRIAGSGVNGQGAINNLGGDNTFAGAITNTAAATIGSSAGTLTLSGSISNSNYQLIFTNAAGSSTVVSGNVYGSGPLWHDGAGATVLARTNTLFTGAITNNAGMLIVATNNALGTVAGATVIRSGGTLAFSNNVNYATAEQVALAGAGAGGVGALNNYDGNNTFAGAITNNAASTIGTSAGALTLSGVVTNSGYLLTMTNAAGSTLTLSGIISGTGGLNKDGAGATVLSGANTYSGGTTLSAGTLTINNAVALGTGTFTISGSSTIDNTSGGTITLSNNNAQNWNADFTFTGSNALNLGGGAVTLGANRQVTVSASTLTVDGVIGGGFSLAKAGAGALTLTGANTYSGGTTLSAGTLNINNAAALGTGTFTISGSGTMDNTSGGTITLSNNNAQNWNADFTFTGGNALNLGSGAVTLGASRQVTVSASTLTVGGVIGGGFSLTKAGAGTLTLSGVNTYSGATTINAGTVSIGADNHLGAAPGSPTAGQLTFGGGTLATTATLTLDSNRGIAFTSTGVIDVASGTTLTYGGIAAGAGGLNKTGVGTLTLSGANTYTGVTTNSAGTVVVASDQALGTAAGGTTVASGATLGFSNNVNYAAAETLDIAGTGVGGLGAILNFSGANTFAGNITNTAAAMIGSSAGSLTLSGSITNSGFRLTVTNAAGSVVTLGGIVAGAGGLFHDGDGTTILAAANTYTGATTNRLGTLVVAADGALGTAVGATRVISGATLAFSNNVNYTTAETIGIAGSGTSGEGAINNLAGDNIFAGNITNAASASTIGSSAGSLTLNGSISNNTFAVTLTNAAGSMITLGGIVAGTGSLFHDGAGTTILAATNTYTGATTNRLGTLVVATNWALGGAAQGTRILSGAALAFSNNVNYTGAEIIGIAGTGTGAEGAINNLQGANVFAGVITNTAASTIGTLADSLTLSGNVTNSGYLLTLTNAPGTTLTISGQIQGAGGLNKDGTGVTVLSAVNQYWGATTLSGGTLQIGAGNAISNASAVTVGGGAILDLNGFSDRIGSLDGAGNVTLGAGRLYAGTNGTTTTSSGAISGTGGLTKEGTGTMTLAGVNTYDGVTTNLAGTLIVAANTALGSANAGTEVTAGATLGLSNNITTTEQITIAGAGVNGLGAINNLSGNNTVSGAITNTAAATIGASAGTLTLSGGAIANAGFALTFTNAGGATIQVNAPISGAGALRTLGAGATVLLTNNTFTGNSLVSAGTLNLQVASALGSATNVTVNTGGTVLFSGATGVTDRINDVATMTFLGGTLESPDYTETLGILTLGADSIFNLGLGGGQGALTFSNAVWTAGTLTINNWVAIDEANPNLGGSDDRFLMTVNPGAGFLTNIFFSGFGLGANWISGELTPSNSPSVWTGGGANNLWGTAANWNPSGTPTAGRSVILVGSSGQLTNNLDGAAAARYGSLTFATNAAGSFLIGGNALTNGSGGIVNKSGYLQSFTNTALVLSAGQIWNAASNNLFISSGVTNSGYQLTLAGISNITVAGVINGAGGLYKNGAGAAILSGNNLYAGATTNEAGTLIITVNNALGTAAGGTVVLSGGTLGFSNSVNYSTTEALTLSGNGAGGQWGALSSLGGSNTFAGAVTLAADSSIGASAGYLVLTSTIANGGFLLSVTNAAGATNVLTGVVSGTGGLAKFGAGILTLNAANTYGGATIISNGALRVGAAVNVLPNASAVTIGALGTLDLNNFTNNIGSLAGDGTVTLGTGSLRAGGDNTSTTFAGAMTGSGVFTKAGTGAMTLAGASAAYSGLITNSAGTLVVAADNALGTAAGGTTIASGATLGFSNSVNYAAAETVGIAGTGVGGLGAILNLSGDNIFAGNLTNTAVAMIGSTAGSLTLNGSITNSGFRLTVTNAPGSVITLGGIVAGAGGLFHDGAGTTILAATNTYTGATTNRLGTLVVATNWALGTTAGATRVISGATLAFSNNVNYAAAETVGIEGSGTSGEGAINNLAGDNIFAGNITNAAAASTIGSTAGSLTLNGSISNNTFGVTLTNAAGSVITLGGIVAGTGSLFHDGAGTTILAATNTYTGATTNRLGTLVVATNWALGTTAGGTRVFSGATLAFSNNVNYAAAEFIGIAGTGTGGEGVINNLQGNNIFAGTITNAGAATIGTGAGALTLSGSVINGGFLVTFTNAAGATLTASAIISGTGGLNKDGAGTTVLSGANTYGGGTTLSAGTLNINHATALGTGTFTISGSSTMDNTSGGAITLANNNAQNWNADFTFTGGNALNLGSGAVTLGANRQVTVSASTLTAGGVIGGGFSLTKAGAGTLTLTGANTYSGGTTLSAGTLNINHATALGTGTFTISGSSTMDNTSGGAITLANNNAQNWNADFTFTGGNALNLGSGAVTLGANRQVTVSASTLTAGGVIGGGFSLTKAGAGTLTLTGANTYSGGTTFSAGTLNINHATALGTGTFTISGSGTMDNTSGGAITLSNNNAQNWNADFIFTGGNALNLGSGAVTLGANRQVTVSASTLTVGGVIGGGFSLTKAGAGTLTLSGANTYSGATTINAGTVSISADNNLGAAPGSPTAGQLTFGGGTLATTGTLTLDSNRGIAFTSTGVIDVASGTTLTYGGIAAGAGGLNKTGAGTLTLSGVNTYTGVTTNSAGTVVVASDQALGTTAGGTTVASGATLGFSGGVNYAAVETIGVAGTGVGGSGAILNISGNNLFAGNLTNTAAAMIGSSAGTLTLNGAITNSGFQMMVTNAAGSVITLGGMVAGSGTLFHDGAGMTVLAATNTYTGATTNRLGTLVVATNWALGTVAQGTRVLSGATLAFSNNVNYTGAEMVGIAGAGTSGEGAVNNRSGANAFAGVITNTAAATIGISAGALTLSGNLTNSGYLVTLTNAVQTQLTVSGVISGAGGLNSDGAGTNLLSGVNQYTGATAISGGTLKLGVNDAISNASAVTVAGAGTLDLANFSDRVGSLAGAGGVTLGSGRLYAGTNGTDAVYSGVMSGTGGLTKEGAGTMILAGPNSYSGATTNAAGTLVAATNNALGTAAGATVVTSDATLGFSNSVNYSTAEQIQIAGAGVSGRGAINNLSGNNTFAGVITNTAAATIGANAGTLTLSGVIDNGGNALTFTNAAGASIQVSAPIGGAGALRTLGAGATVLFTNNTFTGNTLVSAGTLNLQVAGALGGVTNVTVNTGGTVLFSGATGVADRINDVATMTFLGGTLESPDYTETLGILALGADSIFNLGLGGGQGALTFSNAVWTAGTLTINNWVAIDEANPNLGGSDDRFLMTVNPGAGFLTNIFFSGFGLGANWISGELTPSNSPSVWTGAGGDNLWGTSANWNPAGTPAAGRSVILVGSSGQLTNNLDGAAAARYGSLTFATNAAGSFLIGGNALTNGSGGIVNKSQYLQSFTNTTLVLSAKQSWNAASNSLFISSSVKNSGYQLTLTGTSNLTLAGAVSGSGGLSKSGAGAAILSGNNSYTGATTNEAGTLIVTVNNALGTTGGGTVILNGGTLGVSNSVNYSTAEALTLSGNGAGGQWGAFSGLGGSNTFAGAVTLAADSSIGASAGYLVLTSTIANGGFLLGVTNAAGATNVLTGVVSGTGGLAKFGGGILTLNAANTYSGATTISNGALRVGAAVNVLPNASAVTIGALGTLDLNNFTNNIGSLAGDGTLALGTGSLRTGGDNTSTTFAGAITGSGVLTKAGTGTMALAGASAAYSGLITNSAGALVVAADNALGTAAGGTTIASGATLGFSNSVTYATAEALTISGAGVGGQGSINNLGGSNTFAGSVTLAADSTVGGSTGYLDVQGAIVNGGNWLTVTNVAAATNVFSGVISGVGGLTKVGDGTLVLTGASANLFSGATTNAAGTLVLQKPEGVNAIAGNLVLTGGTLLLGASNQIANASAVTMTNATFRTGGYSDTVGVLTLEGSSVIDMNGTSSVLRFDDSSGATWLAGTLEIDNYTGASDQIFFGIDDTALTAGQLDQIIFKDPDGLTGYFHGVMVDGNGRVTLSPVPEPSGIVAGILLIPMLLRRAWRRMMGAGL